MGVVYLSLAFICILVLSINFIINIRNFYVHSFVERRKGETEKKREREREGEYHPSFFPSSSEQILSCSIMSPRTEIFYTKLHVFSPTQTSPNQLIFLGAILKLKISFLPGCTASSSLTRIPPTVSIAAIVTSPMM